MNRISIFTTILFSNTKETTTAGFKTSPYSCQREFVFAVVWQANCSTALHHYFSRGYDYCYRAKYENVSLSQMQTFVQSRPQSARNASAGLG